MLGHEDLYPIPHRVTTLGSYEIAQDLSGVSAICVCNYQCRKIRFGALSDVFDFILTEFWQNSDSLS